MNREEQNYLDLLKNIITTGSKHQDRTGVGTYRLFGTQLRFSLEDNTLPLITTKKVFTRGIIEELLLFLRGSTNTKELEAKGVNIWHDNTTREFLDKRGLTDLPEGDMGKSYGYQWRRFNQHENDCGGLCSNGGVDQLKNVIDIIKTNPNDRRIIMTAWNPAQINEYALPACHTFCQFMVDDGKLSCLFYLRSSDFVIGFPFNLASYAILTRIIANVTKTIPHELIFTGGDTHVYNSHLNGVIEQISREPYPFPQLYIDKELNTIEDIEKLTSEDFRIVNYKTHEKINYPMAV